MAERNEISRHEVEVFRVLRFNAPTWKTNAEIAAQCSMVAARTVRAVTRKLVALGIVDQAEVFPAHQFRLAEKAAKRNRGYTDRLERAAEVFGVTFAQGMVTDPRGTITKLASSEEFKHLGANGPERLAQAFGFASLEDVDMKLAEFRAIKREGGGG